MIGRMLRRANSFNASPTPIIVPIAMAITNEKSSRISVFMAASGIVPSSMPCTNAVHTVAGVGRAGEDVSAAAIHHRAMSPAMPASGGPTSRATRLTALRPLSTSCIRSSWISVTTRATRTSSS